MMFHQVSILTVLSLNLQRFVIQVEYLWVSVVMLHWQAVTSSTFTLPSIFCLGSMIEFGDFFAQKCYRSVMELFSMSCQVADKALADSQVGMETVMTPLSSLYYTNSSHSIAIREGICILLHPIYKLIKIRIPQLNVRQDWGAVITPIPSLHTLLVFMYKYL